MKTIHGWAFPDEDEFMAKELAADGTYQRAHLDAALGQVTDFSLAIDGGAHVGSWSRLLSARFTRVIAIEPSPDTYECLVANMAAFGCANVECLQAALGREAGRVAMAPLAPRAAALKNTGARFVGIGTTIPRITIDSLAVPTCGFLKLDIEGSEPWALDGAAETLRRCQPIVLYENKRFWQIHYGLPLEAPVQRLTAAHYVYRLRAGTDVIWGPP